MTPTQRRAGIATVRRVAMRLKSDPSKLWAKRELRKESNVTMNQVKKSLALLVGLEIVEVIKGATKPVRGMTLYKWKTTRTPPNNKELIKELILLSESPYHNEDYHEGAYTAKLLVEKHLERTKQ